MRTKWFIMAISLALILPLRSWSKDVYADLDKTIPYEDIQELRVQIEIGVADLLIEKTAGNNLLEAKIHYKEKRGEPRIRFDRSGSVGYLTIKSPESDDGDDQHFNGIHGLKAGEERWELRFSSRVASSFDIEVGLVDGTVDMTGLQVTELRLSSGLSDLKLRFDEPNPVQMSELRIECGLGDLQAFNLGNANFERARLEGGLGSLKIGLSGAWRMAEVELKVDVGLGSARLEVPGDLGIEVNASDNFLSSVDLENDIKEVHSGLHRSKNWEAAAHRLIINADVGLGSLKVERTE